MIKHLHHPYFTLLCFLLILCSFFFIDRQTAYYFHGMISHPWLQSSLPLLNSVTELGTSGQYFALLILLGVINFFYYKNKALQQAINYLFMTLTLSSLLCVVIKIILSRARPPLLFDHHLYGFYFLHFHANYWSFPSGHSATIASLMSGLSFILKRYAIFFLGLMVLIAISRIVLCFHFVSDVLAGIYLGIISSSFLYQRMFISHVLKK